MAVAGSEAIVETARRLADEVLFPAALATDAADTVPRALLDALAEAGLYGLRGPGWAGGMAADLDLICAVTEALAAGCLTTTFVWSQHGGTPFVVAAAGSPALRSWIEPLCRGAVRSGLALAGAQPGPDPLRATRVDGGWRLDGRCPWISGWGQVDVLHTAAVADDASTVWMLVDARPSPSLRVARTPLVALHATATVDAAFDGHRVPEERVTVITPPDDEPASGPAPAALRIHAALALGVVARCCRLLGPSPLDAELAAVRRNLATGDADAVPDARAGAAELALRAAAALMSATGAASLRRDRHPQRLAREALFVSVFAAGPVVRDAFLARLGATPDPGSPNG
ncbi:MAG: acyl-CoA dehydrogenase family protein [Egibacteraceae bacterium]